MTANQDTIRIEDPMAEFHDIGKIVDWWAAEVLARRGKGYSEPHDFEECKEGWGIDYKATPWQSIFRKDNDWRRLRTKHWPNSTICFLAQLADGLSAGFSRALPSMRGSKGPGVHCLWSGKERTPRLLQTKQDLRSLIQFINSCPSWMDVVNHRTYGPILRDRAETAEPGLNVTSLLSHCALAGKIARALANAQLGRARELLAKATLQVKGVERGTLTKVGVHIYLLEVAFLQRPFRSRELGLFELRRRMIKDVIDKFANNVLLACGPKLLVVFFGEDAFDQIVSEFSRAGFVVYADRISDTLDSFWGKPKAQELTRHYGLERVLDPADPKMESLTKHGRPLPKRLALPICESCQMAHADKRWPEDLSQPARASQEGTEELLCTSCFQSRRQAIPLTKMDNWLTDRAAWVHVFARMKHQRRERPSALGPLGEAIRFLHRQYLQGLIDKGIASPRDPLTADQLDEAIRPRLPIVADFIQDYHRFLAKLNNRLVAILSQPNLAQLDQELWCARIEWPSQLERILLEYHRLLDDHFAAMLVASADVAFPIGLRISVSGIKHPFFAHWRFLDEHSFDAPSGEVAIQAVGSGVASLRAARIPTVLSVVGKVKRHALHRLASVARTSPKLAQLMLEDKTDKHKRDFRMLKELIDKHKIDFPTLVTLSNLLSK